MEKSGSLQIAAESHVNWATGTVFPLFTINLFHIHFRTFVAAVKSSLPAKASSVSGNESFPLEVKFPLCLSLGTDRHRGGKMRDTLAWEKFALFG